MPFEQWLEIVTRTVRSNEERLEKAITQGLQHGARLLEDRIAMGREMLDDPVKAYNEYLGRVEAA